MPNTLAHIGVQIALGRCFKKPLELRWVALGLIIPDLPWIFQRIVQNLLPSLSGIEQRAYFVVQSSPLFCAVLSLAIAICFQNTFRIFAILIAQSLIHLLMDAAQVKYGAAIPFFGPISWQGFSFGFYAMDGWLTYGLTISGILVLTLIILKKLKYSRLERFIWRENKRYSLSLTLVLLYILTPPLFKASIFESNLNDLGIWSGSIPKIGHTVHFDRSLYKPGNPGLIYDQMEPQGIPIRGIECDRQVLISTSAVFVNNDELQAKDYIIHPTGARVIYSLFGLAGVGFIWIYPMLLREKQEPNASPK